MLTNPARNIDEHVCKLVYNSSPKFKTPGDTGRLKDTEELGKLRRNERFGTERRTSYLSANVVLSS